MSFACCNDVQGSPLSFSPEHVAAPRNPPVLVRSTNAVPVESLPSLDAELEAFDRRERERELAQLCDTEEDEWELPAQLYPAASPLKKKLPKKPTHTPPQKVSPKPKKEKANASRSRNWCFTVNNYDLVDETLMTTAFEMSSSIRYLIYGREVAPGTGTKHLQGFISFSSLKSLSQVKKEIHQTCHWEIARGSVEDNYRYCSKDGDFVQLGYLVPRRDKFTL